MNETIYEWCWEDVQKSMEGALLVSWDSCHKIYISMDPEQAGWFERNYNGEGGSCSFRGTDEEMLDKVMEWYAQSCGLRFVSAVWTNNDNPNDGFKSLVPQFTEVS
jgi:hypothetical protein